MNLSFLGALGVYVVFIPNQIWKSTFFDMKVWMPHSTLLKPVQRPARSLSPFAVAFVQGQQPMER